MAKFKHEVDKSNEAGGSNYRTAQHLAEIGLGYAWPAGRTWWGKPLPTQANRDAGHWHQGTASMLWQGLDSLEDLLCRVRGGNWCRYASAVLSVRRQRSGGACGLIRPDVRPADELEAKDLADAIIECLGSSSTASVRVDDRLAGLIIDLDPLADPGRLGRLVPVDWSGPGAGARAWWPK